MSKPTPNEIAQAAKDYTEENNFDRNSKHETLEPTSYETVGPLRIEVLGKQGEYDLLKLSYRVNTKSGNNIGSYIHGVILRIRPEDLYKIAEGCEYPHRNLRPMEK